MRKPRKALGPQAELICRDWDLANKDMSIRAVVSQTLTGIVIVKGDSGTLKDYI